MLVTTFFTKGIFTITAGFTTAPPVIKSVVFILFLYFESFEIPKMIFARGLAAEIVLLILSTSNILSVEPPEMLNKILSAVKPVPRSIPGKF